MDAASFTVGVGIGAVLGGVLVHLRSARRDGTSRRRELDETIEPLRLLLARLEAGLTTMDRERVRSDASIGERLQLLLDGERRLQEETARLTKALSNPTTKGRWGEVQLRRVVELAGMVAHVDFELQPVVGTGDGAASRPDLVIHLPEGRDLYVDAKAPMEAFLAAAAAHDEASRIPLLRDHARQVRSHVDTLASRRYERLAGGPELVVMFLPGEALLSAALEHDGSLLEHAIGKGVMLASPTSLVALLRAVAFGWERKRVADGAAAIAGAGRELAERIQGFAGHLVELRRGLDAALQSYNRAVGSFEARVLPSARRLHELGGAPEPAVPAALDVVPRSPALPDERAGRPSGRDR